jgi:hypothetical protein
LDWDFWHMKRGVTPRYSTRSASIQPWCGDDWLNMALPSRFVVVGPVVLG